ncbi:MAG: N-acetyl-gamma-glutamyl-phosphate reductase [Bacteroidetes bacterium]|nr:N-acetyl-gamma-glutamyl-phosphate reductase [Bacteroidota bacterium]
MKKIKAGIIGGAGYTGGEIIRLLLLHPDVEIAFVQSASSADQLLSDVHTDLLGDTELKFVADHRMDIDVLFLCGGHDAARKFLKENDIPDSVVVIDLSQDFRHSDKNTASGRSFIYGLPELNREKIKVAKSIANPGCFATSIELALLPLSAAGALRGDIYINATTGSTGAGQAPGATTHFSWRDSNLSVYKPFAHQHLREIAESLKVLQPELASDLVFIPQRGNFTRGIHSAIVVRTDESLETLLGLYENYYSVHPFVHMSRREIDMKQVVNTNKCLLHLEVSDGKVLITSVIDNLLKGASGQAVQNMNIIFGLSETTGLLLKPSAF